jgi:type VI secretion system protein ImpJ
MDIRKPLYWHQGLFLQPQHFQLTERYTSTLFAPWNDYFAPHFWGTGEMEIQKSALGARSFTLTRGSFLFPDGTHVTLPGNAVLESRHFEDAWIEGGKPFTVYLGLKKWNYEGENVSVADSSINLPQISTRFLSLMDSEECKDLHSSGPSGDVKQMQFVLGLFWESEVEQLGDYLLLPIARLERMGEEIVLSERYIPPCLVISANEPLFRIIKEIRDLLASRGRQLEEYKKQRGIQTAEFGSRDMVYLLALRSLNRYIPILMHLTETKQVHPWTAYGVLRQIVGEFSSFSETVNVLGELVESGDRLLPIYDHRSLGECFSAAQSLIIRLLDEITAGPEYVISLRYDGTYFAAEMKAAHFEGRNRFYLVLRTEQDPKAVIQSMTMEAKLSSREHMPILIARALPGIGLEHLPVPPQELPRRAYSVYFFIDSHNDQWSLIEKTKNIALYWDKAPEDLEAELMIVGRS